MQLAIIAGGKGTRLGLKKIPKPMLEVNGIPMLIRQILLAKRYGINEVFILTGHLSEVIENHFQHNDYEIEIKIIKEETTLGSGGCLKLLEKYIENRFMVFNGDLIMDFNVSKFISFDSQYKNSYGTILVHPNDHPYDSDLVEINDCNQVEQFHFKPHKDTSFYPNLVNAGVFIFSHTCFEHISTNTKAHLEKDIIGNLINNNLKIYAYQSCEYIKDAGTPDRVSKVEKHIRDGIVESLNSQNPQKCIFIDYNTIVEDTRPINFHYKTIQTLRLLNSSPYLAFLFILDKSRNRNDFHSHLNEIETILGHKHIYFDEIMCARNSHPDELKEIIKNTKSKHNIDLENSWLLSPKSDNLNQAKYLKLSPIQINIKQVEQLHKTVSEIINH